MKITGNIVDIKNRKIYGGTVVFEDGRIISVEKDGKVHGNFIIPPFIDAHVHVESSMLVPSEFARLAAVHGTGACVSDPHEIANVLGMDGVRFMLDNAAQTPFRFFFGAPSCVPATPFETSGGTVSAENVAELFRDDRIKYLSEMMNFPGVLSGDETVMKKLAMAKAAGRPVDGHAPLLQGEDLEKYIAGGITTDHEAVSYEEGREKISLGMKIQIREGSAAKNFDALFPLIDEYPDMCMLCSDDLHPDNLAAGHINLTVKRAVAKGADIFNVLNAACLTPVGHYGLDCGLLRAGDSADFIVVDGLKDFNVKQTWIKGVLCAENGVPLLKSVHAEHPNRFCATEKTPADFALAVTVPVDVITVEDGQLVTGRIKAVPDSEQDILKITVVNRYCDSKPAMAFAKNFGLKKGAFASCVAHDSHNIICVGCDDASIAKAVNLVIANRGGLSCVCGGEELSLPLPVGGIMTDADGYVTAEKYRALDSMVKGMGSQLTAPFMTLSFMALLVIPSLKISDKGLFDVEKFAFVSEV